MYLRFNAERSLETAYFALLRDRISTLSEQLSAMTISFVTSKVVAPEHVDGMRLDSACHGLTAAVAMQFTRDAIERHRQQRLHQRKQEAAFAEERAKELKRAAAELSKKDAEPRRDRDGGNSAESAVRPSGHSLEEAEEAAEAAKRGAITAMFKVRNAQKQLDATRSFDMKTTAVSAKALRKEKFGGLVTSPDWDAATGVQLGAYLIDRLLTHARFKPVRDDDAHAREEYQRMRDEARRRLYDALVAGDLTQLRTRIEPDARPMLTPPLAWQKLHEGSLPSGGQLHIHTEFVRTRSHRHLQMLREMDMDAYSPVIEGLHALSRTRWSINERVLSVVKTLWDRPGLSYIPDCPKTVHMPSMPVVLSEEELSEMPEEEREQAEMEQEAMLRKHHADFKYAMHTMANLHSQRATAKLKLAVADDFAGDTFYFPHNLDFRGRTYAVGPHLQYLGDDLVRGLLTFDEAKPLGEDGLYWLKVQLANLYGMDKLSLDDRVRWAEKAIDDGHIKRVDALPMKEASIKWWTAADNPVQTLALTFELQRALEAPDPKTHLSRASVHMDGSCNGLQHYAALGRDSCGAAQVNLVPRDKPADIYSGVRQLVEEKVRANAQLPELMDEDLKRMQEQEGTRSDKLYVDKERRRLARLLDGHISRKVVKQTVMTSVYGVTKRGARDQIYNRLRDIYDDGDFPRDGDLAVTRGDLVNMASYVADLTLDSLDENFAGASRSMAWLVDVAALVASDSRMPVEWVTPLGWPVVQPYFRIKSRRVRTVFHNMTIKESADLALEDDNQRAPVNTAKQKSALPPNYVHSLDSSHMLMTAKRCSELGMTFAAVHDSYWTHACDVRQMNTILREEFVRLHEQTTLEGLLEQLKKTYSCCRGEGHSCAGYHSKGPCTLEPKCMRVRWEKLPDPPPPGDFDIDQVKESTYFFS